MKSKQEMTIIEEVRSWKEQNAAEYGFDVDRIIASAREREAKSSERVLDPPATNNGEVVADQPAAAEESKSE